MLCTKCHHKITPVVSLDIDGTLGDYHGHFLAFAEQYLGLRKGSLSQNGGFTGNMPFKLWFCRMTGNGEQTWNDIKLAYRQGAQKRSMPIKPGAWELTDSIKDTGAELWLCTTRPHLRLDSIDPDTREWLRRSGIEYDGLLYGDNKYELLSHRIDPERLVAVLDDEWEQLINAKAAFQSCHGVIRIRNNWNFNAPRWPVTAGDLFVAKDMILAHIEDWNIRHAFDDLEVTEK